ncbi:hypothetical protein A0H81_07487 [Grifola frondosa]|uniref:Uncharacterized protein n=1 Tax=Grifola frondosa TaxID=5627 RepID=A0A1C7M7D1_GRIFR|nr:hypothetical protein A0H81_07487 [Grifola frondosa]
MPVSCVTRRVDEETGQLVEGTYMYILTLIPQHFSLSGADNDMVFKDDERQSNPTSFKFLQAARAWKNAKSKKSDDMPPPKPEPVMNAPSDVAMSHNDD